MLTESDIQISFRKLFQSATVDAETLEQAELLLDELRPESPLRHRLREELESIRRFHESPA